MARHLSFRSGNPALNKNSFRNLRVDRSAGAIRRNELMTIKGTVDKTALSLTLLLLSGYYVYSEQAHFLNFWWCYRRYNYSCLHNTILNKKASSNNSSNLFFMPRFVSWEVFHLMYGQMFEGIVFNAITLTVTILFSLLLAYRSGIIKAY